MSLYLKQQLTSVEDPDIIVKALGNCTDLANGLGGLLGYGRGTASYGGWRLPLLVWIILHNTLSHKHFGRLCTAMHPEPGAASSTVEQPRV